VKLHADVSCFLKLTVVADSDAAAGDTEEAAE
jgi:large subunit ribosomal protein L9